MKVRPNLLQQYELEPALLPQLPVNWPQEFGRIAPMAVEIGFGNGEYLDWWAGERPDWNFVGIEMPQDCVIRALPKFAQNGHDHIRVVRGDARYLLRELFAPDSLEHVLMQFPMPWTKAKQAKHRVYSPQFSTTLADVLKVGGYFELVTDQEWYAKEAAEVLGSSGYFKILAEEINPERPFRTRYEQKWLEDNRSIFRVLAQIEQATNAPRLLDQEAMEIVHLKKSPLPEAVLELAGKRFSQGSSVLEIKEVFTAKDGWILYIVTADDSFSQHSYVRVQQKTDGRVLVRLQPRPRPYPTPAVHFALQELGRQLDG
jgi:tRNA (guanine-N7-)-methyltransferase